MRSIVNAAMLSAIILQSPISHAFDTSFLNRVDYAKSPVETNRGEEQHIYTFHMANGDYDRFQLNVKPSAYPHHELYLYRSIEGKDVFSLPETLSRIKQAARNYERKDPRTKIKIISRNGGELSYAVQGKNPKKIQSEFNAIVEQVTDEVAKDNFHFVTTPQGTFFDYAYVSQSQRYLTDTMARKFDRMAKKYTVHQRLGLILRFVQNIPYDSSNMTDQYFRTPISVIKDNKGDCDEKSLLLAMMLKKKLPKLEIGMLTIHTKPVGHAIVMVEYPWKNYKTVTFKGKQFLPLETTYLVKPGVINKKTQKAIAEGNVRFIPM